MIGLYGFRAVEPYNNHIIHHIDVEFVSFSCIIICIKILYDILNTVYFTSLSKLLAKVEPSALMSYNYKLTHRNYA